MSVILSTFLRVLRLKILGILRINLKLLAFKRHYFSYLKRLDRVHFFELEYLSIASNNFS